MQVSMWHQHSVEQMNAKFVVLSCDKKCRRHMFIHQVFFTIHNCVPCGSGVFLSYCTYPLSSEAFNWCSCNKSPLGGISWLTLTTGNEHCNTEGIKKMTSWFSPLVGKSMCICVRYISVSVSKQAHTAECNINVMATCCVHDSSCTRNLRICVQWKSIISDCFSIR